MAKKLIVSYNRFGFISQIKNPSGRMKPVHIVERAQGRSGFTAVTAKQHRKIAFSVHAESLGMRLAKKGHRLVQFLD